MKKILSLLIAVAMLFSLGVTAMAEETAVAKIGETTYATLAEAAKEAKAGDTIEMIADATLTEVVYLPANITFNGNGKQINGEVWADGNLTFAGHIKVTNFNAGYNKPTITIGKGACLELTGNGRMVIGHGATFNITGNITDAKTANTADLTPSLIIPGASFTGAGVNFNVTNAYIKTTASYCSSSKSASGTFDFNITNSVWEQFGKLAFEAQSTDATVNFELKDSVLTTTSHLVFGVSRGEVVIDNSNVNVVEGNKKQLENRSTMTIKNGSVVYAAVATSSNAINPGTLIVDNATYVATGEFSGASEGAGKLILKNGATATIPTISKDKAAVEIGEGCTLTTTSTDFTITAASGYEVKFENGVYTTEKAPVAKIGETTYTDLHTAMTSAKSGETVELVSDVDLVGTEWEPVSFKGKFNGKGFKIKNLTINKPGVSSTGFITSLNSTFENVTFENPTVTGGENTGVLAGRAGGSAAYAKDITVTGTIKVETTHTGYARAAAIVGGWAYGKYENITVDGIDKATSYIKHTGGGDGRYVAGIVGHADGVDAYINCTVKNITISGGWLCGGIAGPGPSDGIATGCAVENIDMGADYSGGMFGWYCGSGTIENSSVKNVTFTAGNINNGAIGGYQNNDAATVTNVIVENVKNKDGAPLLSDVAKIGEITYTTLEEAFSAAKEGQTITLLADATPALTSQRAITKAAVIDLNGKTLTLKEDDLYFGTTTFKNGNIVVDPSVKPSTAVFWMFANQTLTFDKVKITATGVTGTYLIGLDGNNSDLNLLNGSEIFVNNETALDLDIICVNASTGNDIVIEDSKVSVTNLDGRVFFRGNYTVSGTSDIDLSGITKAGFRIEAGQTLKIEDTATVDIVGEPRDGGIHITDTTAVYTVADTATVNATVNKPKLPNATGYIRNRIVATAGGNIENDADKRYQVRFLAGIDSLNYKKVGFEITANGKTVVADTRTVYTKFIATNGEFLPTDFGDECKYIYSLSVNFPYTDEYKNAEVTVKPFAVTKDNKTIWAAEKTIEKIYDK